MDYVIFSFWLIIFVPVICFLNPLQLIKKYIKTEKNSDIVKCENIRKQKREEEK